MNALVLVLLLSTTLPAAFARRGQADDLGRRIERLVPRMASAQAQLGHARRLKRQLAGKEGEEQDFWRRTTVEAYQAVRIFHPEARELCAEAAFRAGEVLRAGGDESAARAEFQWSAEHGERTEFRARARLEIGHLMRRAGRWREALAAYLDVGADVTARSDRREDAWLWAGTSWKALGSLDEARQAWRRVAEQGTSALARVQAFDELALALLESGDPEGAAGMLDRCLRALSAAALEETETGERVRNALLRMRIVDELRREIERKNASSVGHGTSRKSLTR